MKKRSNRLEFITAGRCFIHNGVTYRYTGECRLNTAGNGVDMLVVELDTDRTVKLDCDLRVEPIY